MRILKVTRDFIHTEHGAVPFPRQSKAMAAANIVAPFTILSAKDGAWQARKRRWLSFGIQSELGRKDALMFHASETEIGQRIDNVGPGSSVFDPVLCELMYQWFSPVAGHVVDPFAGGSVRGIVAYVLGRRYWGCDLSADQVAANRAQAESICPCSIGTGGLEWVAGDSRERLSEMPEADFLFSCPPYGDLETYSDDPADLSAMSAVDFLRAHARIILLAAERLREHRFAVWVVGNYRASDGSLFDFAGETVRAFRLAGCSYYNDIILATPIGSAPVRCGRGFEQSRKCGRVHQQVLVFVKGDPRLAVDAMRKAEADNAD